MHNELLTIGNITIYGYGLMIAIGIFAAYLTTEYRAKKKGLDSDPVFWILIFGVVSGFLGSKLLYIITVLDEVIANPASLLDIADGWVVYGGIIAGILGGALCCKIRKVSFLTYLDLVVPAVALAQGFGRIGCFLAGCCYGHESHLPIAITFHDSAYAPNRWWARPWTRPTPPSSPCPTSSQTIWSSRETSTSASGAGPMPPRTARRSRASSRVCSPRPSLRTARGRSPSVPAWRPPPSWATL